MKTVLPSHPRKAIWYFVLVYWIVTILGILLTIAFAAVFKPRSPQELGVPLTQAPLPWDEIASAKNLYALLKPKLCV